MPLILLISFLLGAACGSFLITAVFRLHENRSLRGRSKCDDCGTALKFRDLIPILSFFFLRGTCGNCKKKISFLHPLVECIVGLLFVFVAYMRIANGGVHVPAFIMRDWYIVFMLAFIFIYDALFMEVEDRLVVPAIATIFLVSGVFQWQTWTSMALGALVGGGFFLIQYVVSRGKWVGAGDILIGIFLGAVLGIPLAIVGLFVSYIIGAAVSAVFLFLKKNKAGDKVPMGVYLSLGIFLTMFWGEDMLRRYTSFL